METTKQLTDFLEQSMSFIFAVFFSLFGGAARMSLSAKRPRSFLEFVLSLVIAGFSGSLAYQLMLSYDCAPEINAAVAGVAGLLGDDLLTAVLYIGDKIRKNPEKAIVWLLRRKERGEK